MDRREEISAMITGITGAQEARKGQVDVLEHLVDEKSDAILVAATGYGKSVVLYAFAALTKKLTIQIVPLTKLGKNQVEDIHKNVPNSRPVLVDQDTVRKVVYLPLNALCHILTRCRSPISGAIFKPVTIRTFS